MAISCRIVARYDIPGGTLIGGGATIGQALISTAAVAADEWLMLATFGGIQLELGPSSVGGGLGWPDNNQQLQAWLAHPSIYQTTAIPNLGAVHALESEPTGVQVRDTPPALMSKPGVVTGAIPAGSSYELDWYHNLSGTVEQQDYIALVLALKTTPGAIIDSFGLGIPSIPEVFVKPPPAVAPTSPTLLSTLSVTMLGSFRTLGHGYLMLGAVAWAGDPAVSINAGWTTLLAASYGSLNGILVGREVTDLPTKPDYLLQASWPTPVYATIVADAIDQEVALVGGLHVWQRF